MDAISDPGRPSRRDRRRARKLVDTAFAEQRLTAADRALRTQRIEAAHTRGDLVMITRDLLAPAPANLGRALDPDAMSSMRGGSVTPTQSEPSATLRSSTPTLDLSGVGRKVRLFVLLAVGGIFASCVLGLVAFIPAVIGAFKSASPVDVPSAVAPRPGESSTPGTPSAQTADEAANLHSAAGWTQLVDAIKAESGTTEVYDIVAYPQYASVGLDGGGAVDRRFYRNGWQESVSMRMPATGPLIDLAEIDADVIARLPQVAARDVGIDEPTGTYIIVNGFGGEPRIMVYVQSNSESRYRAYRLDGTPMS